MTSELSIEKMREAAKLLFPEEKINKTHPDYWLLTIRRYLKEHEND